MGPKFNSNNIPESAKVELHQPPDKSVGSVETPSNYTSEIREAAQLAAGANDIRVGGYAESFVADMRQAGKTVDFIRFSDEGHLLQRDASRVAYYSAVRNALHERLISR